jgi:hypothetical protein
MRYEGSAFVGFLYQLNAEQILPSTKRINMIDKTNMNEKANLNQDAISGEIGAHPVGTGIGAASGLLLLPVQRWLVQLVP